MDHEKSAYEIATAKLNELVALIDDLAQHKKEIEEKETRAIELFGAWYKVWKSEEPPAPEPSTLLPFQSMPLSDQPQVESSFTNIVERREKEDENYGSKTIAVRAILEESGETGITPKELSQRLTDRGIKHSESFASNTLFRLKGRNEVATLPNGRYALSRFSKEKGASEEAP